MERRRGREKEEKVEERIGGRSWEGGEKVEKELGRRKQRMRWEGGERGVEEEEEETPRCGNKNRRTAMPRGLCVCKRRE